MRLRRHKANYVRNETYEKEHLVRVRGSRCRHQLYRIIGFMILQQLSREISCTTHAHKVWRVLVVAYTVKCRSVISAVVPDVRQYRNSDDNRRRCTADDCEPPRSYGFRRRGFKIESVAGSNNNRFYRTVCVRQSRSVRLSHRTRWRFGDFRPTAGEKS